MAADMPVSVIAIAGITGKLGQLTAETILSTSDCRVQGFCRDKSKVAPALRDNSRVTIVEGQSSDPEAARKAVRGSQVVICMYLGPDDLMLNGQKVLIDACVEEKVPRYVAADYTLDYRKLEYGDIPSKDIMKDIVVYLEDKPVKGVHIITGCLIEVFWHYLGMWDANEYELSYWATGDEKWDFSTYANTAQYVTAAALDPTATGVMKFCGDRMSANGLAKLIEQRYGEAPKMKHLGSLDDLRKRIDDCRGGEIDWSVMPFFYTYYIVNGQSLMGDDDDARYPQVEPVTAKMFLEQNDVRGNPLMTRDYLTGEASKR
ncbi:MAG: hypothetical protein M1815_002218 [Lichina confinis]|nr:MAG: hypothetical protein M1815_002218 [Lichina confinis]